ncbi:PDZ domain-containing protein [Peribacillus muralis]|uniref:S1C family serine protease n=1 Tax=Peribacillus muralis TaxID=264697 RepID=UPI001F4E69A8|nr:trypsin-like peptidase domain-containing protein [Peribacillus muralis]MCK1994095.1 trypsin-like peptidase domain-containing protein [Peribacillus muralis]MCK2014650.1 trypsin-like peptidase domain-containing protein [Peribacillus muralis]
MEDYKSNEQVRMKQDGKKGKSLWMTSLVSGTIASVVTSSVFMFSGDFVDQGKNSVDDSAQTASVQKDGGVTPQKLSTSTDSKDRANMVESASKSIVGVVNLQENQNQNPFQQQSTENEKVETGTGSGVIYKKENGKAYIITNNHVIEGAKEVEISLYDGQKAKAAVVGADALTDLAVLTIDASKAPDGIKFGNSDSMRPGEEVLAIGNPLGLDFSRSVTQGIVSATGRSISVDTSDGAWALDVIQTDAAINPGNSGGALINTAGEVIGINSLKISESGVEGLGFAIPSNDVIPIVTELIDNGKITRPYLGVSLASIEELPQYYLQNVPEAAKTGVMITSIEAGSAAEKGGLKQQDIIMEIDGTKISTAAELRKYLYNDKKIGEKVKIKVYRGMKEKTVTITLQKS